METGDYGCRCVWVGTQVGRLKTLKSLGVDEDDMGSWGVLVVENEVS